MKVISAFLFTLIVFTSTAESQNDLLQNNPYPFSVVIIIEENRNIKYQANGFIFNKKDRLIATNLHVVEDNNKFKILVGKNEYAASIIWKHEIEDISILQIDALDTTLHLEHPDAILPAEVPISTKTFSSGDQVTLIGFRINFKCPSNNYRLRLNQWPYHLCQQKILLTIK